jgi:hypothetical protein
MGKGFIHSHVSLIMTTEPCDGCGRAVQIAGGIANLWSFGGDSSDGLTLEFEDGSVFFLCYDCIETLPEDARTEDVAALDGRA